MKRDDLVKECKFLHPDYTEKQITEWVNHTLKTHPNQWRARTKSMFVSSVWLWLWRLAVLATLLSIAYKGKA